MVVYLILAAIPIIAALWLFVWPHYRRRWLLQTPFPDAWLAIVKRKVLFFDKLQVSEQHQLLDLIRQFIASKQFFGCNGLVITDEIRVTIAAEACLLLLNRHTDIYPGLRYILVYPDAFAAQHESQNSDGTVRVASVGMLGESWSNGKVILSWEDVERGLADPQDGHNVVLHEFSHQLDSENGSTNGLPPLSNNQSIKAWAKVFSAEFAALNEAAQQQHVTVMDYYGATNAAEFFAVATETFFEKPLQLQQLHPELYDQLSKYYRLDPKRWI